jgi:hypothetical protein
MDKHMTKYVGGAKKDWEQFQEAQENSPALYYR